MAVKRPILTLLTAVSCFGACTGMKPELDRLESVMHERPDSVLAALEGMKSDHLLSRSLKARFALLYSQALDMNYISVTSDSIISPAVLYYRRHGSAKQKLKTCYYRALISENQGWSEDAMEWLKKGEEHIKDAGSPGMAGRLYNHKAILYFNSYACKDALTNEEMSAKYFLEASDSLSYSYRLNDIAKICIVLDDYAKANDALVHLREIWDKMDITGRALYYSNNLVLACEHDGGADTVGMRNILSSCREDLPDFGVLPNLTLLMAHAYVLCGMTEEASDMLALYDEVTAEAEKTANYYLVRSEYHEAVKDYKGALECHKKYVDENGQTTFSALNSETKLVEERYEAQIQELKQSHRTKSIMLSSYILLAALMLLIKYIITALKTVQAELSDTEMRYRQIEKERNSLREIQEHSKIMDAESLQLVSKRLEVLDKVLIGHMSQDPAISKEADNTIDGLLKNKDEFILSTSKVFSTSRPNFCQYLRTAGLTEFEIGYCCLFVMGLYAKDIEPYFSKNASNVINNTIRNKLALPKNGVKLRTFLCEKCTELG